MTSPSDTQDVRVPLFGARAKARDLAQEVKRLRAELDRVGGLSLVEVERRRDQLAAEVRQQEDDLRRERAEATEALEKQRMAARSALDHEIVALEAESERLRTELENLRVEVVETREVALLQEAGIYEYRHPLTAAVSYQYELGKLRERIKAMARADGDAVQGSTSWAVNGSEAQGRKMVRDYSKLMLRAYNAEADNLVRALKPYKVAQAIERLMKVAATIERLGKTMGIQISETYQQLRVRELELTADYLAKVEEEREREREKRQRLREERKAQQEMERERARLEKERLHYMNALQAVEANEDEEAAARLRSELEEIERAIKDVDYRAANIRAGYVYVISNLGSFGDNVVKIGMTRRLDPEDRVRELGDASVPFRYDTHALFFSDDAVGIESTLHEKLAERRVNQVNARREFFYATPQEVKEKLRGLAGDLLSFEDVAEALEYRQSQRLREERSGHVCSEPARNADVETAATSVVSSNASD